MSYQRLWLRGCPNAWFVLSVRHRSTAGMSGRSARPVELTARGWHGKGREARRVSRFPSSRGPDRPAFESRASEAGPRSSDVAGHRRIPRHYCWPMELTDGWAGRVHPCCCPRIGHTRPTTRTLTFRHPLFTLSPTWPSERSPSRRTAPPVQRPLPGCARRVVDVDGVG